MLDQLIRFSLNRRFVTLSIALGLVIVGVMSLSSLPVDVFPDLNKPTVTIVTEAHGRAPEEVEVLVTLPIETQLNGLPGLASIRSTSGVGLSIIYVQFEWGTDIFRSRQLVAEKLSLAKQMLPSDVQPMMGPISSLMGQIQQIAIYSTNDEVDPIELRSLADWVIRPRLLAIPGVAQVIPMGGGLKQYQILISAEKISMKGLTIEDLAHSLGKISQNTTGGYLNQGQNELLIRNIGLIHSLEDIKNTVVGLHFGKPVLLSDIAEVKVGHAVKRGDSSLNANPSVTLVIQKQPDTDTVKITKEIEQAMRDLTSSLPDGVEVKTDVFKQASFIEASIQGVKGKLALGTIFVFLILFLFLANLKMSLITLTAIPLSFLITFIVFKFFGLSINTMTLGGLAIAIGELVDDSIVDVENIFRRLRENARLGYPKKVLQVVFEASKEVRNSIVIATLIIGLVFIPLLNLGGIEGRLFTPLAIAYLTALLASLLVSLTVTPTLCYFLIGKASLKGHLETPFVAWLKRIDEQALRWSLARPKGILAIVVCLLMGAVGLIPFMGNNFLPEFNEGTALVTVGAKPGVNLAEANRVGTLAEELILQVPEVKSVSRRTGRAEKDEHAMGLNVSEIDVDFVSDLKRSRTDILDDIRAKLSSLEGMNISVGQPIAHMIDHMSSGVAAQVAIKIFGQDLQELRRSAIEIKNAIADIKGLVDIRVEQQGLLPQLKIHVLRDLAADYGLPVGEITSALESALNGEVIAQVIEGQKYFDVFYRYDDNSRANTEGINNLILTTLPDGKKVRVADVADVYQTQGPSEINRDNGQRRTYVSANVSGRDLVSVVNEIKNKVADQVQLPVGTYLEYGGQFEAQASASKKIFLFGMLSLVGIGLLLYSQFKSGVIVAQIMLTIPFAFIGGIITLFLVDGNITIASLVGFITLSGIACRNGIMMISHYLHLMKHEGESFGLPMVIRGSLERLVPVLMTAMVASLALMPLVFAKGQTGSEILHPVALVIVGGLVSSTLLDILVTPTIFYWIGKRSAERYINQQQKETV